MYDSTGAMCEAKRKQSAQKAQSVKFWLFEISFRKIHFEFSPRPVVYLNHLY